MIGPPASHARPAPVTGSDDSDALVWLDASGMIRFATAGAARLLGRPAEALVGQSVWRYLAPQARLRAAWDPFAADAARSSLRFRARLASAASPVELGAWRLPEGGGFLLVCHARPQPRDPLAEEQRRAERFRALYDVNQAISQLDLRSVLEVVYRKLTGLMDTTTFFIGLYDPTHDRVQLVGSYDHGQYTPDEYQSAAEGITGLVLRSCQKLVIHDTERTPLPSEVIIQDEQPRSVMMMPLLTREEIVGVITVQSYVPHAYTDDDETLLETIAGAVATAVRNAQLYAETRLRADELAAANARLEAQDALRRELVYQITHDIRGPLQVIYGYADVILEGVLGPVTDGQREVLQMMIKRSRAIEAMTQDILAVGPINRQTLSLAPVDLIALCQQAARDARIAYPDERFHFETVCAAPRLVVEADYNRLSRVLDNLLNNAVKFSPQGGTITLRAEPDPTGVEAQVSVSDQGVGIDPASLPYIFERFYRGSHTGHARFDGSGLGLFIAQQIIEAHNGRVRVDSQAGSGSTFTFCLPLAER